MGDEACTCVPENPGQGECPVHCKELRAAAEVADACRLLPPSRYVMPGWGCCKCQTYNGAQRGRCVACGHIYDGPLFDVVETKPVRTADGIVHAIVKIKLREPS